MKCLKADRVLPKWTLLELIGQSDGFRPSQDFFSSQSGDLHPGSHVYSRFTAASDPKGVRGIKHGVELAWTPVSQPGPCYLGCPARGAGSPEGAWCSRRMGRKGLGRVLCFSRKICSCWHIPVWGIAPTSVTVDMCMLSSKIQLVRLFWAVLVAHFLWCDCSGDRVAVTTGRSSNKIDPPPRKLLKE